jgi:hypothetical protein
MPSVRYDIDDTKTFDANLQAFIESLQSDDPQLAEVLKTKLRKLLRGEIDRPALWNALHAAIAEREP